MAVEREHIVTLIIATIAILVIVGGYASFSGLSVQANPLGIVSAKSTFKQSEIFDAHLAISPVTFMEDESIMLYMDNNAFGVIALKKYLDDNSIDYGTEVKNLGQNNIEIITLKDPLKISLSDFVSLEYITPDKIHTIRAEFSNGDAMAEAMFSVE